MPEIWVVTDARYGEPGNVADAIEKYVRDVFIDDAWNINTYTGYDCTDAPRNSDGDYVFGCGNDKDGLFKWWANEQTLVEDSDDCALLAVPYHHYSGGCGVGKIATAGVGAASEHLSDPDKGHAALVGNKDNGDYCYDKPAKTIGIALQEMGHSWKVAHADGMIWTNDTDNVNIHTPMMLGDGQSNNCGYDYDHDGSYADRVVSGYTECAAKSIPHSVLDYSESYIKSI